MPDQKTIHATCVAFKNRGVLLTGRSGAGKSDLALRLIHLGGVLVSDDQVVLSIEKNQLIASPPANLAGLLEIRGVGICTYEFQQNCAVIAVVELESGITPERIPDLRDQQKDLFGIKLAHFQLEPFHTSAPLKIFAMLEANFDHSINKE